MKERFNIAFNYLKGQGMIKTQKDAAQKIGMAESNLSKALKGNERYLTESFMERFNESFGNMFNEDWLITGNGEMLTHDINTHRNENTESGDKVVPYFLYKEIKDENKELIEEIARLKALLIKNSIDFGQAM